MSRKGRAPIFHGNQIECVCGNSIYTNLEETLSDEVDPDDRMEDSEECECGECGRVFKLTIGVSCVVETDFVNLEEVEIKVLNDDGEEIPLNELPLGASVDLPDGTYQAGRHECTVQDGVLVSVWIESVTEEQLQIAI